MERIFYNKRNAILFVTAMLALILLVCMLLVTLTQMVTLNQKIDALKELIEKGKKDIGQIQDELAYMQTDEYVIQWALEHNRLSQDDVSWIRENVINK